MNFFQSTLYGIVQGVTEFLPVSSSAHLALIPKFLKMDDPGVLFDLAMHVGTAFAILVYFKKDIKDLISSFFRRSENKLAENMLIATVVSVAIILIFKQFNDFFRTPTMIAINLIVFGLVMFFSDRLKEDHLKSMEKLRIKEAFFIGLFQAFALMPGVSRSGITISIARIFGLSRQKASSFSFLLSLPIILGGALIKLPIVLNGNEAFDMIACVWGIVLSFLVGLLTIHYFLKFIAKIGLVHFVIYRFLLAAVLLLIF